MELTKTQANRSVGDLLTQVGCLPTISEKLVNLVGRGGYDYIDYYHDDFGNLNGLINEVQVSYDPFSGNQSVSWNDSFWNSIGGSGYDDHYFGNGGGSSNGGSANNSTAQRGEDIINNYLDNLGKGKAQAYSAHTTSDGVKILNDVSLVATMATVKFSIIDALKANPGGILSKIGTAAGATTAGLSTGVALIGITDGEISQQDVANGVSAALGVGAFIAGVFSLPVTAGVLGIASVAVAIYGLTLPGDNSSANLGGGNYVSPGSGGGY